MRQGVPARTRLLPDRFASETRVARGLSRLPRLAGMAPHVTAPPTVDVRGSLLRALHLIAFLSAARPGPAPQRRSPDEAADQFTL